MNFRISGASYKRRVSQKSKPLLSLGGRGNRSYVQSRHVRSQEEYGFDSNSLSVDEGHRDGRLESESSEDIKNQSRMGIGPLRQAGGSPHAWD